MKHTIDELTIRSNKLTFKEIIFFILIFLAIGGAYYFIRFSNQSASVMAYIAVLSVLGIWIGNLKVNSEEINQKLQESHKAINKQDKYIESLENKNKKLEDTIESLNNRLEEIRKYRSGDNQ